MKKVLIAALAASGIASVSPVMAQEIGQYQAVPLSQSAGGQITRALILDTKNGHIWEWSIFTTDNGPYSILRYQGKLTPGQSVNPIPDYPNDSPRDFPGSSGRKQ
jgi:hypothetical protein